MKRYANLTRQERIDTVLQQRRSDLALVLENLTEELNYSAIIRTAEAFGVGKVCIIYPPGDKPKLSKNTSSGATNWLDISFYNTTKECLELLKSEGYFLLGALVDPESKVLWEQDFTNKVAIIVGNEARGMTEEAQSLVDANIYLPMYGLTESLNVGVAAGIFLYEVIRQREKTAQ